VRNVEVLRIVKEERRILRAIKRRNANWIGHILRKDCFLIHVTEGKIEKIKTVKFGYQRSRKLRNCYEQMLQTGYAAVVIYIFCL
jgi:hypothetical protein